MIAQLTGTVVETQEKALILDVGGVGYRVALLSTYAAKIQTGEKLTLRIYHQVAEGIEALYGFADKESLYYFELLLKVPGVGPKTALGILDIASPATLEQAVAEDDVALLTKVSGIGKKTAERILVELKTKIKKPKATTLKGSLQQEAIEALVSIGYKPAQARAAVSKLPKDITTVEQAIKVALQHKNV